MQGNKYIAIDFETNLISELEPCPAPICLSLFDGKNKELLVDLKEIETRLQKLLIDNNTYIITHNAQFELNVIDTHFKALRDLIYIKLEKGKIICSKVVEQLINCNRERPIHSFSLSNLVNNYLKVDISEDKNDKNSWRYRYSELKNVPLKNWPKEAVKYAIDDSIFAYTIYVYHQKEHQIEYKDSVKADFYLNKMALQGMDVDLDRVLLLEKEVKALMKPNQDLLIKEGLLEETKKGTLKRNLIRFKHFCETEVENQILEKTSKNNISTSAESLTKYVAHTKTEKGREILNAYLNLMKYDKVCTTYIQRLKTSKGKIRTSYSAVVNSGRTSSSTTEFYPSVNIQQMPREIKNVTWDIRNCFVPRKGFKICSIDYSGLELASTAHRLKQLTGRTNMVDIINKGNTPPDLHSLLAYRIKNIKERTAVTYEEFVSKKKESGFKEYRQLAKPINLGFPGGIGYDNMRTILSKEGIHPKIEILATARYEERLVYAYRAAKSKGYPVRIRRAAWNEYQLIYDELVLLKETLFGLYPDLEYFLKEGHLKYTTGKIKKVKNEFNEWENEPMYKFEFLDFKRDWCMYTQICNNSLMQSPAAIGAKRAISEVVKKYGNSEDMRPLAFIHDEIVFEVIDDIENKHIRLKDICKDVSEIMLDKMQEVLYHVRIAVEVEVFDYWKKSGGFYTKQYWKNINDKRLYEA